MRNEKTLKTVQLTVLTAIILLMSFTPIGYLKTMGLEISLLTIPVAVGAMLLGPVYGMILGGVFGITSFVQCFGLSAFGLALLNIDPIRTFLVCVPTRMLAGLVTGYLFKLVSAKDRSNTISYFLGGAMAALFNTLFFMTTLILCFWNTPYLQSFNEMFGGLDPVLFAAAFVGVNGVIEAVVGCVAGGAIGKAVSKVIGVETYNKRSAAAH